MTKLPINHKNTIIYKIVCNDPNVNELYVSHTTNFIRRRALHKSNCYNASNKDSRLKVYDFIRQNKGWTNWNMIEIEKYPCNNSKEANIRERYWQKLLNLTLN